MNRSARGVILLFVLVFLLASAIPASAGVTYTCDPNINTTVPGLCAILNGSTVAGLYNNAFSNANALIYIEFDKTGTVGLGQSSQGFDNQVIFAAYQTALNLSANASGNPIQTAAVQALASYDATAYSTRNVDLPSALGTALGFPNMTGTSADLTTPCNTPGTGTCYNGVIFITSNTSSLYFRTGPPETATQYDFFGVVEHETDELLGTASCVATTGAALADGCPASNGANTPSAVDLFRYQSAGNLVLISTTPGAYFSYNGGSKNGADGKLYNTVANGNDYADFVSPTPCQVQQNIQDGVGCAGQDSGIDITTDGGAEINILNAVGYKLVTTPASLSISATHSTPISQGGPGTITLTVTNTGGPTAGTAMVIDGISANFIVNSTSNGNNASNGCSLNGTTAICTIPPGSSFTSMTFTVYFTASSTAGASTNSPTLNDTGDTVTVSTVNDNITPSAAAPQVDSRLMQTALSGSTDNGTCAAGNRTLTATVMLGNTSGTTLTNPYGTGVTLTQSNTLLWQIDPASIQSTFVLPFYFHIQLANCNTFRLTFDVNSN